MCLIPGEPLTLLVASLLVPLLPFTATIRHICPDSWPARSKPQRLGASARRYCYAHGDACLPPGGDLIRLSSHDVQSGGLRLAPNGKAFHGAPATSHSIVGGRTAAHNGFPLGSVSPKRPTSRPTLSASSRTPGGIASSHTFARRNSSKFLLPSTVPHDK